MNQHEKDTVEHVIKKYFTDLQDFKWHETDYCSFFIDCVDYRDMSFLVNFLGDMNILISPSRTEDYLEIRIQEKISNE